MAVNILHLIGEQTTEDALGQLRVLLTGLPQSRFRQRLAATGKVHPPFELPPSTVAQSFQRMPLGLRSMQVARLFKTYPAQLLITWDVALTESPEDVDFPPWISVVSQVKSPGPWAGYWSATGAFERSRFVCLSETIRQRLLAGGLRNEAVSVIQPVVDFAAVRQADRGRIRGELGLEADARVLLTAGWPSHVAGQYVAVWATAILYQVWPDVRMILPGGFREDRRARRLAEECYCPEIFRVAGEEYTPAELLAASDLLVIPAAEDQPAGWLAWAMAAGVPIVASGVPSVRELIRDGRTGFLVDSTRPHTLATRIRLLWEDEESRRRCAREASYVAYEMFRPQKCLDSYLGVFDCLLGAAPGGGKQGSNCPSPRDAGHENEALPPGPGMVE